MDNVILVINPGSTSTKIALFENEKCKISDNVLHDVDKIKSFKNVYDQKEMRTEVVLNWLKSNSIALNSLSAVVGRGGLLRSIPGGTYKVTEKMLEDLKIGYQAQHASNLGGIIANIIAQKAGVQAFIVDPVAVDEIDDIARISGIPQIVRKSLVHALNTKAVCRKVCREFHKDFENSSFVVAHIGGGISISPVKDGRIIDTNNASEEGPFSPERTGTLPCGDLVELAFSGRYSHKELRKKIVGGGGLVAYLGTNNGKKIADRIEKGDGKAKFILEAMAYQIAKEIGAMSIDLNGKVDAVILTGGMAYSKVLVDFIKNMVSFIAPVEVIPGELEMLALAQGVLRVLQGKEKVKIYDEEVSFV
ncbi:MULTISPECIES: butyrate kinase [Clostridium]|jgi:butyrate kinase|uniref:Probable butyrate kinase n=1 Tax=Clostridium lapidicellarium TaxID=3240931 RepID=A0ABV4E003_9CLOT|nr:butyrate kinase [uncultured Clostridium sp.]NLU06714.1 butyrate kinase [Clostridiales bacterium]